MATACPPIWPFRLGTDTLRKVLAENPFGEPDIDLWLEEDGRYRVKVKGVDVFDPSSGEEEKVALKAGMDELRLRFKQRQATICPQLEPPPGRFDEVYERGVKWLNRLG